MFSSRLEGCCISVLSDERWNPPILSKALVDYCYFSIFLCYPPRSLPQFFLWRHQLDRCWWRNVKHMCVSACVYVCVCVCTHPTAISTILYSPCNGGRRQLMRACVLICYLATLTVPARRPRQQLLLPVIDCSATGEERRDITLNHRPAALRGAESKMSRV